MITEHHVPIAAKACLTVVYTLVKGWRSESSRWAKANWDVPATGRTAPQSLLPSQYFVATRLLIRALVREKCTRLL